MNVHSFPPPRLLTLLPNGLLKKRHVPNPWQCTTYQDLWLILFSKYTAVRTAAAILITSISSLQSTAIPHSPFSFSGIMLVKCMETERRPPLRTLYLYLILSGFEISPNLCHSPYYAISILIYFLTQEVKAEGRFIALHFSSFSRD